MSSDSLSNLESADLKNATAEDVIKKLDLQPDVEGGYFRQTYLSRGTYEPTGQHYGTGIYYLIVEGRDLAWHKVLGKDELWHFYAGDPVKVAVASPAGERQETKVLGPDIFRGQEPQLVIPADHWQSAGSLGKWSLVGCTIGPGFEPKDRLMAPKDWQPTSEAE